MLICDYISNVLDVLKVNFYIDMSRTRHRFRGTFILSWEQMELSRTIPLFLKTLKRLSKEQTWNEQNMLEKNIKIINNF